jgi:hypothetical protein
VTGTNATASQIALAWLLHVGPDIAPIPGTTKLRHFEENLAASEIALTDDEIRQLETAFAPGRISGPRYTEARMRLVGKHSVNPSGEKAVEGLIVGWMRASSALSTRQKWMGLIRQHEQSGEAVKVFCRDRGVSEPSFYSWRKHLATNQPVRLALVETSGSAAKDRAGLQLILASGDRLRIAPGTDAATLRTVLNVLRELV